MIGIVGETALFFPSEEELNARVQEEIDRVIAKLTPPQPPKPKPWGFWKALGKTFNKWTKKYDPFISQTYFSAIAVFLVLGFAMYSNPIKGQEGADRHNALSFLFGSAFLLSLWVAQAIYWMIRSRKEVRENALKQPPVELPSHRLIHSELVKTMQETIEKVRHDAVGPDSPLSRRIAEHEQKIDEARGLRKRLKVLIKEHPTDTEFPVMLRDAEESIKPFEHDWERLKKDQESILTLLSNAESRIPIETLTIEKEQLRDQISALQQKGSQTRQVSRDMIVKIVTPIVRELIPLNTTRERLMLLSASQSEGPDAIERFLQAAESSATRQVGFQTTVAAKLGSLATER